VSDCVSTCVLACPTVFPPVSLRVRLCFQLCPCVSDCVSNCVLACPTVFPTASLNMLILYTFVSSNVVREHVFLFSAVTCCCSVNGAHTTCTKASDACLFLHCLFLFLVIGGVLAAQRLCNTISCATHVRPQPSTFSSFLSTRRSMLVFAFPNAHDARYSRPIAYTEIGYCSGKCSRTHTPSGANYERHAMQYTAVFEAFRGVRWFAGARRHHMLITRVHYDDPQTTTRPHAPDTTHAPITSLPLTTHSLTHVYSHPRAHC
jgi:hypothetical protein